MTANKQQGGAFVWKESLVSSVTSAQTARSSAKMAALVRIGGDDVDDDDDDNDTDDDDDDDDIDDDGGGGF